MSRRFIFSITVPIYLFEARVHLHKPSSTTCFHER